MLVWNEKTTDAMIKLAGSVKGPRMRLEGGEKAILKIYNLKSGND